MCRVCVFALSARNRAGDQERLLARCYLPGQGCIGRLMGQILRAGEEAQERAALRGHVVPDRAAQHRVARLERVEYRRPRERSIARDVERDLAASPTCASVCKCGGSTTRI